MIKIGKAEAAEIVDCGAPLYTDIENQSAFDHCDIYTRQLAFREESLALRQAIQERVEDHAAPRKQSREDYEKKLEELHNSTNEDNIFTLSPKD